jgi:hypothetical protein
MDDKRATLRHTVATVAYRGGKAVRGAPESFAAYSPDGTARTPVKILTHIGDLFDWALTQAKGAEAWNDSTPLEWDREIARFFAALTRFDEFLASEAPLATPAERIFQGAVADALTHIGQLAMHLAGGRPHEGENYCAPRCRRAGGGSNGAAAELTDGLVARIISLVEN